MAKENLKEFVENTAIIKNVLASLSEEKVDDQDRRNRLAERRSKLDAAKNNTLMNNLVRNGQYDAAYNLAFDPAKQGAIKNETSEALVDFIREDIKDLSLDEALGAIDSHPEVKAFLKSLDKENFYMDSLKSGKYTSIKDLIDNTYVQEAAATIGQTTTLAQFRDNDRSIIRTVFQKDPDEQYTPEQEQTIAQVLEIVNDKEYIGSLIAHELDHKKTAEKGGNDYEYTSVNGVRLFDTSLEDWDRKEQAKEISGDINSMIYFSERYQETGVIGKAMKDKFPAYAEAIEKGLINPKSTNPTDNEKEIKLMCQIAQNNWDNSRKDAYGTQVYAYTKEYSRLVSEEQSKATNGKANIREESVPLTINKKMQNIFTYMYKGKETNFSQHIDFDRIKPYDKTKDIQKDFSQKIEAANRRHQHTGQTNESSISR